VSVNTGSEGLNFEDLAAQMLGTADAEDINEDTAPQAGHPAWQEILGAIPQEYHAQVADKLRDWDAGVSRRFQGIHDQYAPLREFAEYDPDDLKEAVGVYQALNNDPQATWEAIGRVYGLSPQQVSQAASISEDEGEDFELDDLPAAIQKKLSQVDIHDEALNAIAGELLARQAKEKEAQEDAEFEEYMEALHSNYGDFDDDYVIGLIASGVDGEAAVDRFQQIVNNITPRSSRSAPTVMSGGGGIPSQPVDLNKLSNRDTQSLVAEILRQSQES
jgi:hypothetical protein